MAIFNGQFHSKFLRKCCWYYPPLDWDSFIFIHVSTRKGKHILSPQQRHKRADELNERWPMVDAQEEAHEHDRWRPGGSGIERK